MGDRNISVPDVAQSSKSQQPTAEVKASDESTSRRLALSDSQGESEGKRADTSAVELAGAVAALTGAELPSSPGGAVVGGLDATSAASKRKDILVPIRTIVLVTPAPLLPLTRAGAIMAGSPSYQRSLQEPQMFRPSSLDCKQLLQSLVRWQQQSVEHAVLLINACGGFSAQGWVVPYDPDSAHDAAGFGQNMDAKSRTGQRVQHHSTTAAAKESEDMEDPRARLRILAQGRLDRRSKPLMAGRRPLAEDGSYSRVDGQDTHFDHDPAEGIFYPARGRVVDEIAQFSVEYDIATVCPRRSFWDVRSIAATKPTRSATSTTGWRAGDPACFEIEAITDSQQPVAVTLGPVVGRVTGTSAVVLMEFARDTHVELLCVDQITGAEFSCTRLARALRPCTFTFDLLVTNRAYDIVLAEPGVRFSRIGLSDSSLASLRWREAHDTFDCEIVRGSFCTLRSKASNLTRGGGEEKAGGGASPAVKFADNHEQNQRVVASLREEARRVDRDAAISFPAASRPPRGPPVEATTADFDAVTPMHRTTRVLVVGENKPSWTRVLAAQDEELIDTSGLGRDREHLAEGGVMARTIGSSWLARSWSSVELVIHCGYSADLSGVLPGVVSLLARAEALVASQARGPAVSSSQATAVYQASANARNMFAASRIGTGDGGGFSGSSSAGAYATDRHSSQVRDLLAQAEDQLRGAYRLHWGASVTRDLLAHGAHLFVSSPSLDLLNAFGVSSLRQLAADLSPFCTACLIDLITVLDNDYQRSIWKPEMSSVPNFLGLSGGPVLQAGLNNGKHQVHYLAEGKAVVFSLSPRLLFQQDNSGTSLDNLIPEEQLDALDALLHNSNSDGFNMLILASPLPLVLDDPQVLDTCFLSTEQKYQGGAMAYTPAEVLVLLDLLAAWMEESLAREVVVVTGGVGVGLTSIIEVTSHTEAFAQQLDEPGTRPVSRSSRPASRMQRVLGSVNQKPDDICAVRITKIECMDLKNVEFLGKNDVYVKLQLDGEYQQTATAEDAGSNASFTDLDLSFTVSPASLLPEKEILMQVFDENKLRAHVLIGEATVSLQSLSSSATPTSQNPTILTLNIFDSTRKKQTGVVHIHITKEQPGPRSAGAGDSTAGGKGNSASMTAQAPASENLSDAARKYAESWLQSSPAKQPSTPGGRSAKMSQPESPLRSSRKVVKPPKRRILHLCCGPIIGVCGDDQPREEFFLRSSSNTFQVMLQSVMTRVHCGLVQISDPDDIDGADEYEGGGGPGGQAQVLSLGGAGVGGGAGRRMNVRVVNLDDTKEILGDIFDGNAVFGTLVDKLWENVKIQLSADTIATKRPSRRLEAKYVDSSVIGSSTVESVTVSRAAEGEEEEELEEVAMISKAVRVACSRSREIINACHALYSKEAAFGLPQEGGGMVEESSLAAARWVLTRMPPDLRAVCASPSSFIARQLWDILLSGHDEALTAARQAQALTKAKAVGSQKGSRPGTGVKNSRPTTPAAQAAMAKKPSSPGIGGAGGAAGGGGIAGDSAGASGVKVNVGSAEGTPTSAEMVTAYLCSDSDYFYRFIAQLVEAQTLLEYFAEVNGLLDGIAE